MNLARAAEQLMAMTDGSWERHANPASAWSRVSVLPLIALAAWSRIWLGWWALGPGAIVLAWLWINPRLFPPPRDRSSWMTRGVYGERIWIARSDRPIPRWYVIRGQALLGLAGVTFLAFLYGLVQLDPVWTVVPMIVSTGAKMGFVRLMAHLFDHQGPVPDAGAPPS
ncbi:DUF6653 family protein [Pseudooceanicola sp. C21-150M6]|uniref:DUF6653 family protein n=1 Tax=Pseudooceanicola sp. C21-150M6 TaxID=3434355 RepID=UPI003D7F510A